MKTEHGFQTMSDGHRTFIYRWLPKDREPKAILLIAHGMVEHAKRYHRFASALAIRGFAVYAPDFRGHGQSADSPEKLGDLRPGGMASILRDFLETLDECERLHPGVPMFLFGHSMGSFLAQWLASEASERLAGLIVSGTMGPPGPSLDAGILVARLSSRLRGEDRPNPLLAAMTFGTYNRAFRPHQTDYDWLSRDSEEVRLYIEDPACGYTVPNFFYEEMFRMIKHINKRETAMRISKALPVLFIAGDRDPLGEFGKGVSKLAELYRKLGIEDVSLQLYRDARHELLNETNREEVTADIIVWLEEKLKLGIGRR